MIKLTKNERKLVKFMISKNKILTAFELSDLLSISISTIYRNIKSINQKVNNDLIVSYKGKGFIINNSLSINNINFVLKEYSNENISPEERRSNILLLLLFKSPYGIDINKLFKNYYISEASINKDITLLRKELLSSNLKLYKKNEKIFIKGDEKYIRKLIYIKISKHDKYNISNSLSNIDRSDFYMDFALKQIENIEYETNSSIPYPYNINIFFHILILIKRFNEGKIDFKSNNYYLNNENINKKLYKISTNTIKKIGMYLNTELPISEIDNLYQYLISSRINLGEDLEIIKNNDLENIIYEYIDNIKKYTQYSYNERDLYIDLEKHLKPMLIRLDSEINIRNNLLEEIKIEYKEMFNHVKIISKGISKKYNIKDISDEELGYLTLYFVKNLEKNNNKKILIICSSGVGTSELIKVKVKKEFPNLEIVDVLSKRSYFKNIEKYTDIDFILSTIYIEETKIPVINVSVLFTELDKNKVKHFMEVIK